MEVLLEMIADLPQIFFWLVMILGIGISAFPIAWMLLKKLPDGGFGVAVTFGVVLSGWIAWILAAVKLLPFSLFSAAVSLLLVMIASGAVVYRNRLEIKEWLQRHKYILLLEIGLMSAGLVFWTYIRGFQPDIQGLEKFMDGGFVNSILRSKWMPPPDPWLAGYSINYYYFGHYLGAYLTKLSGLDTAVTYNLLLATVFSLSVTGAFSIIYNFSGGGRGGILGGFLGAGLLNFGGNLHTVWHFLSRQTKPYWYPDATRFIPYTIHEFPMYSHVVADLHGHLIDLPIVLLFLTITVNFIKCHRENPAMAGDVAISRLPRSLWSLAMTVAPFGFLLGIMSMTNTWDVPIYGLVLMVVISFVTWRETKEKFADWFINMFVIGLTLLVVFALTSLPFHLNFQNFAKGVATVEVRSQLWQLGVLWGGFAAIGLTAIWWFGFKQKIKPALRILPLTMIVVSAILIVIPEIIYVKDIYIKEYHRANTMFKLTYQTFVMMSLVFGMMLGSLLSRIRHSSFAIRHYLSLAILILVFGAHMTYPYYAIKSYYNGLKDYRGMYGLNWLARSYPDDYKSIIWLKQNIQDQPVILEAVGESYTDFARVSAFTGLPTVLGWRVHEWLWRGSFDIPGKRTEEVKLMYEKPQSLEARGLFGRYQIKYIFIGDLERKTYQIDEASWNSVGKVIFRSGRTLIVELIG